MPSLSLLSQAQRMKKLSKEGKLSLEKMQDILSEIKKGKYPESYLQMNSFTDIFQTRMIKKNAIPPVNIPIPVGMMLPQSARSCCGIKM